MDMVVELGARMPEVRKDILRRLGRKAKSLSRLNFELKEMMPADVRRISESVDVAFVLYVMVLMGWPDTTYIEGLIFGFPLVGALERPAFFRSARPQDAVLSREALLATSVEWTDSLVATMGPSSDPDKDRALLEQTEKDFGK